MSDYGGIHVRHPTFTKPNPADPSKKRVLVKSRRWGYWFFYRGRTYQKAGFETAADARCAGERRKEEVRAGLEDDWRRFTMLGLYQLAGARKATMNPVTQASFDAVWKRVRRHLSDGLCVIDVDDSALLRFVAARKAEGAAVNTIRLDLQYLRTAMTIANRKRRLPWLPEFPRLKQGRREQTVSPIELRAITALMPEHYRLFFAAAEEVGWRARSELSSRKTEHVDWGPERWPCACEPAAFVTADECPRCTAGRPGWLELDAASCKTDEARLFPMTKRLRSILIEAQLYRERVQLETGRIVTWLFPRSDGERIKDYRKAWATACRRAGIGKLDGRSGPWSSAKVVHDIRRTAIRRWKKLGIDRDARKGMVGHASDDAHASYEARGADPERLRATAVRLDQLRGTEEQTDAKVVQLELFRRRGS